MESIVQYINEISGGNQMIAAALTMSFSGAALFIAKNLPPWIFNFIKRQLITTLTLNNTDYEKQHTFTEVTNALLRKATDRGSRTLTLESLWCNGTKKVSLTIGEGSHLIRYKGKWVWVVREHLESSGGDRLKEKVTISYLGRSHKFYEDLVEDFQPSIEEDKVKVYTFTKDGEWSSGTKINKTGVGTLALDEEVKNIFIKDLSHFINNKSMYIKLGLPYKYTSVLHGLPGSGKTSLVRALASDFNLNLCVLNLSCVTDSSLEKAMNTVPKSSILLIEDFDSCGAVKDRGAVENLDKDTLSFLSLTGVLNSLDGVTPLEDVITFLTTNHLEKIDDAVLRSGRVDNIYELPPVSKGAVKSHLEAIYDTTIDFDFEYVHGKDINAIKFKSKGCAYEMKKLLKEFYRD